MTYLKRDSNDVALVLAGSVESVQYQAKMYGVAIQVNMPGGMGIRAITNHAEALAAIGLYPQATPWCLVNDGLWGKITYEALRSWFGPPTTMDKAMNVKTEGIAWRPDTMPVYPM